MAEYPPGFTDLEPHEVPHDRLDVMPLPEDFGLTEATARPPKLISDLVGRSTASRLGVPLAVIAGIGLLVQLIAKTDNLGEGLAFGLPLGFVTFLIFAFVFPVFFALVVTWIAALQRYIYSTISNRAARAFLYHDALDAYYKHHRR